MAEFLKYALILRQTDSAVLIEGSTDPSPKPYAKESKKIIKATVKADLFPEERKKTVSKKFGKWLAECDSQNIVHLVLIADEYPERLGYAFIKELRTSIKELPTYYTDEPEEVQENFGKEFERLLAKYNDPSSFDKLTSVNKKVAEATDKMKGNLEEAIKNVQDLEVS